MNNMFEGPNALQDFLNPGKHPNLPMVELPASLNPLAGDKVRMRLTPANMSTLTIRVPMKNGQDHKFGSKPAARSIFLREAGSHRDIDRQFKIPEKAKP